MDKKDAFIKLIDDILKEILGEAEQTSKSKEELSPTKTKTILAMLVNLNDQIAEQKEYIGKLEEQLSKSEHDVKFLIEELKRDGYIRIRERRKLLQRNSLTNEAIINLLDKEGIISKTQLREEIIRLNRERTEKV
jgi:biotin operon repressor